MTASNNESIFAETPVSASNDDVVDLIGEGKKYKDVATANKALKDKDAFIESLKREAHEARQEAKTRMSLEDFWQKTQDAKKTTNVSSASNDSVPAGHEREEANNGKETPVDISALVREALSRELTKNKQAQNIEEARTELKKLWGDNYVSVLKQKQEALGLGTDFVDSIAARSPTAFLALVGATATGNNQQAHNPNVQVPTGSSAGRMSFGTNSTPDVIDGHNTQAYYDRLRKEDTKQYFSKEVQLQRHKDALALGEKFFK
jgi:post-segregation antitoxin (ccd killing protein)